MAPPSARDGCKVEQEDDFKHLAKCNNAEPFCTPALTAACSAIICALSGAPVCPARNYYQKYEDDYSSGMLPIENHSRCLYFSALTTP